MKLLRICFKNVVQPVKYIFFISSYVFCILTCILCLITVSVYCSSFSWFEGSCFDYDLRNIEYYVINWCHIFVWMLVQVYHYIFILFWFDLLCWNFGWCSLLDLSVCFIMPNSVTVFLLLSISNFCFLFQTGKFILPVENQVD